jgi:transposase
VVIVLKTRAKTTTILGAISAQGLIKCSLRLPQPPPNKKRKQGEGVGQVSKGTVTEHCISFLKATMDEMDQYPNMKGHYFVMDNAPIHISVDIAKYIESRGYRCAYLPSYSPEFNPIEQFCQWLRVK